MLRHFIIALLAAYAWQTLSAASIEAKPADAFVDTMAVNTHWDYPDTIYNSRRVELMNLFGDLGLRHYRTGASDYTYAVDISNQLLQRFGAKAIIGNHKRVDPSPWDGNGKLDIAYIDTFLNRVKTYYLTTAEAIEGPNEYDINHGEDTAWVTTLRTYTKTMWDKAQADPQLRSIPVAAPSMAHSHNAPSVGDITPWINLGNFHPYPGAHFPEHRDLPNYNIFYTVKMTGSRTLWATETGYHNAIQQSPGGHYPTSELAAGKYGPRLVAEYLSRGIARAFFYELVDRGTDLEEQEDKFGLLRHDLSAKPIFTALAACNTLLVDRGAAFSPGSLDYTLTGDLTNVRQMLLQKRDGTWWLLLWQGVSSWNRDTYTDIYNPVRPLTLTLGGGQRAASIRQYLPSTTGTQVVTNSTNVESLALEVPDHLLMIEINTGGQPDLTVGSVTWAPAQSLAGAPVTFSSTVTNSGMLATKEGTVLGVAFEVDGSLVSWSDSSTASLAPGQSRTLTANGGPAGVATWVATAGDHAIRAVVDDVNRIVESNEGNNVATTTPSVSNSFAFKVNFQPSAAPVPTGFAPDSGLPYGVRSSGQTYGWNRDIRADTRDRNNTASIDQAHDTLIHMQKAAAATWDIAVPNGTYEVTVVCGDASHFNSTNVLVVEGTTAINGLMSNELRWRTATVTVPVTDSKLTISVGAGGRNTKLCLVEIAQVSQGITLRREPYSDTSSVIAVAVVLSQP